MANWDQIESIKIIDSNPVLNLGIGLTTAFTGNELVTINSDSTLMNKDTIMTLKGGPDAKHIGLDSPIFRLDTIHTGGSQGEIATAYYAQGRKVGLHVQTPHDSRTAFGRLLKLIPKMRPLAIKSEPLTNVSNPVPSIPNARYLLGAYFQGSIELSSRQVNKGTLANFMLNFKVMNPWWVEAPVNIPDNASFIVTGDAPAVWGVKDIDSGSVTITSGGNKREWSYSPTGFTRPPTGYASTPTAVYSPSTPFDGVFGQTSPYHNITYGRLSGLELEDYLWPGSHSAIDVTDGQAFVLPSYMSISG